MVLGLQTGFAIGENMWKQALLKNINAAHSRKRMPFMKRWKEI